MSKSKGLPKQKVMSYAEIKMWNERYRLCGKDVYQLDAEFTSLVKIQVQELQAQINKLQNAVHTTERQIEQAKQKMFKLSDILKDVKAQDQVSLSCLLEFSDIVQDKFEDIMERIIFAFGIDFKDENSRINFDMYVKIKCFLKYYTIELDDLKKIWLKIINPGNMAALPKEQLMDLFERFARGRIQS